MDLVSVKQKWKMNLHQRVFALVGIISIMTYCSFIIFLDEQLTNDIHVDKFAVDPNDIERDIDEILNPPGGRCKKVISILVQFLHSSIRKDLSKKLYKLMFSIITGTKSPIKFYFITDEHGEAEIEQAHKKLKEEYKRWRKLPLVYYDIKEIMRTHKSDIEGLQVRLLVLVLFVLDFYHKFYLGIKSLVLLIVTGIVFVC